MKNIPLLLGTLIVSLVAVVGVAMFFSSTAAPTQVDATQLLREGAPSKGPATAAVTIVEFSDFQCPACRAVQPMTKQLMATYPDSVRFVYRHFPLTQIHQYATLAAQAGEAANQHGKFWEFHDILFERQEEWAKLATEDEVKETFLKYGEELGIDKAVFQETIGSDQVKKNVADDLAAGSAIKISATPTFFLNGQQVTQAALPQLLQTVGNLVNTK
jgi:protein-disulfide isomerase